MPNVAQSQTAAPAAPANPASPASPRRPGHLRLMRLSTTKKSSPEQAGAEAPTKIEAQSASPTQCRGGTGASGLHAIGASGEASDMEGLSGVAGFGSWVGRLRGESRGIGCLLWGFGWRCGVWFWMKLWRCFLKRGSHVGFRVFRLEVSVSLALFIGFVVWRWLADRLYVSLFLSKYIIR